MNILKETNLQKKFNNKRPGSGICSSFFNYLNKNQKTIDRRFNIRMKILAIYPWTFISSSALMVNGKLVAISAEERLQE